MLYWWDVDEACDEVDDILELYGWISFNNLCRIADYFDVDVDDILYEFGWWY